RPETQRVGEPVLISDHINLTGANPITGTTFLDLTEVYSKRLRDLVREIDPSLAEGVYVAFRGPTYETPAEIRMLRTLGGDLIGMSTVLEAIAAREAGLEVLGVSLVTNPGAGLVGDPLDHEEVLQVGRATAARMGVLLAKVAGVLVRGETGGRGDRCGAKLGFGTAGLRGERGAGPTRMTRATVMRAAAGLARVLGPGKHVVIGYAARHKSDVFARDTAAV